MKIKFKGIREDTKQEIEGNAFFNEEKAWIAPSLPEEKKALGNNPHISNFYAVGIDTVEVFINNNWQKLF